MNNNNERKYRDLSIKLEIEPSFSHPLCIRINKEAIIYKGKLEITPFQYGIGKIHSGKIPISESFFDNLIGHLNLSQIITKPKDNLMGYDGTTYILTIDGSLYHAKYRWWVKCPPEWATLGNFTEYIIGYVKAQNDIITEELKNGAILTEKTDFHNSKPDFLFTW